jgi:hypothetical protein
LGYNHHDTEYGGDISLSIQYDTLGNSAKAKEKLGWLKGNKIANWKVKLLK